MVINRVIIRVTPFRALITLLITYLLSPLPLQVNELHGLLVIVSILICRVEARNMEHDPPEPFFSRIRNPSKNRPEIVFQLSGVHYRSFAEIMWIPWQVSELQTTGDPEQPCLYRSQILKPLSTRCRTLKN